MQDREAEKWKSERERKRAAMTGLFKSESTEGRLRDGVLGR